MYNVKAKLKKELNLFNEKSLLKKSILYVCIYLNLRFISKSN